MDNERRADIGERAIRAGAEQTGVDQADTAWTALIDVLAYVRHFADRMGVSADEAWAASAVSYEGDMEDGPQAAHRINPDLPLKP